MNFVPTILLGLCLIAPPRDITAPGFKKVTHQVVVENPKEFEDWLVVAATHLGPSHVTVVEPGVPFSYSSKYGTVLYALPQGTAVPSSQDNRRVPRSEFEGFLSASPPVTHPSAVSSMSPVDRVLTTIRITNISNEGIELEALRTQEFDSDGESVGWLRIWAIPGGIVLLGIAGLVFLRRRRRRRKTTQG
ncbi:MAG: hypothetical protein P1V35_11170 [Planctomycetota bacterium]|nr:hypothetical protein [Planctomycetota bacterium]